MSEALAWLVLLVMGVQLVRLSYALDKVAKAAKLFAEALTMISDEVGRNKAELARHDAALKAHARGISEVTGYYLTIMREDVGREHPHG